MRRDAPFVEGETYHLFNRGAHKGKIFFRDEDYVRFQLLLHLGNNSEKILVREVLKKYTGQRLAAIFENENPDKKLVDVLAYCLMPNHFHLILRQRSNNGITQFLKRMITGFSMYFNLSRGHSGTVFQGPTKSRLVDNEAYLRYIFAYLHLNPLDIVEPKWKEKGISKPIRAKNFLREYFYSSFFDYNIDLRPERAILSYDAAPDFLRAQNDFEDLLRWHEGGNILKKLSPTTEDSSLYGVG